MNIGNKHKTIFSTTNHLTRDQLVRYTRHLMNVSERHLLERHLIDCALCSEALKGVSELEHISSMYQVKKELFQRAHKRKLFKKFSFSKTELISIISIVFLILFLLLITFFFFLK